MFRSGRLDSLFVTSSGLETRLLPLRAGQALYLFQAAFPAATGSGEDDPRERRFPTRSTARPTLIRSGWPVRAGLVTLIPHPVVATFQGAESILKTVPSGRQTLQSVDHAPARLLRDPVEPPRIRISSSSSARVPAPDAGRRPHGAAAPASTAPPGKSRYRSAKAGLGRFLGFLSGKEASLFQQLRVKARVSCSTSDAPRKRT